MDYTQSLIHVIACGVLAADLREVTQRLKIPVSLECLPGGLHARPEELRQRLQERIDYISAGFHGERIVVGYGVCGRGAVGLYARNVPLAIARVNDCIALFLGSDDAYRRQFASFPGTYYVSAGWVEEQAQPQHDQEAPIQCGPDCFTLRQLIERYGEENAAAIREFLNSWQRNYQRAAYIDTGVHGPRRNYARLAQAMAEEFGWKYEEIRGSQDLLQRLLTAHQSTDDVLLVPPHHVTVHDAIGRTLNAVPVWDSQRCAGQDQTLTFDADVAIERARAAAEARIGLGIDAGGTYTDVVLYDFQRDEVVEKAKALTTKWDYTIGISQALDRLTPALLTRVDLVSISTTLATNAIVEGRGQKVGLLIFPPYGLFDLPEIAYRPIGILTGQLEIDGRVILPVDPDQVRREVRRMVDVERVAAFAVSGYASHVNPAHELEVQAIIEQETGLRVSCAHDLSEKCNYRIRSVTAALNASIVPYLDAFLRDADRVLRQRQITAPRMVVRSDGTLMSLSFARKQPIATILSGPAASVAGASYLAGLDDAMVVDMGGTTTDTATIRRGCVRACAEGAAVGAWRTHVEALDMRTLGLGGDSLIARGRRGQLTIGPWRVAPVAWLFREGRDGEDACAWLESHQDRYTTSTSGIEFVAATGAAAGNLAEAEQRVFDALADGPRSLDELTERLRAAYWPTAQLDALERRHLIVKSSLTPTDVAHAAGRLELWNRDAATRLCRFFSRLLRVSLDEFARLVQAHIVHRLANELLHKQLGERAASDNWDRSSAAAAMVDNWLQGGTDDYHVHIALRYPIIGIGAPIHLYLPEAAQLLETQAVIPLHADVANAIGAITGRVSIHRQIEIAPTEHGQYRVSGLPNTPLFHDFQQAHRHGVEQLVALVRRQAEEAGTSSTRVEIDVHDRVAPSGYGGQVFIGRTLTARLTGRPDVARLIAST
jgi:N-methylhydantoinase A/oxoprolinase/acetone carboxylase beta subunit